MRREELAPSFDRSKTREFPRYFDDLEALFTRANVTNNADKKKWVLRYVDFDTEQLWKALPEFDNPLSTYDNFKYAILNFYPDAYGDFVYSIHDLEALISDYQRREIASLTELSDFHRQFLTISHWLIKKQQLEKLEQQRAYIRAFHPAMLNAINRRLQLKNLDHHPGIPYPVQDVLDAARFIIVNQAHYSAPQATTPRTSDVHTITTAHLQLLLTEVKQSLIIHPVEPHRIYSKQAPTSTKATPSATHINNQLSDEDRIASLEEELACLRASITPAIEEPKEIFCAQIAPLQLSAIAQQQLPTANIASKLAPTVAPIYSVKCTNPNPIASTPYSPPTSPNLSTSSPQEGAPLQPLTKSSRPSSNYFHTLPTSPNLPTISPQIGAHLQTLTKSSSPSSDHISTITPPTVTICHLHTTNPTSYMTPSNPFNSQTATTHPYITQICAAMLHNRTVVWKPPDKHNIIKRLRRALSTVYMTVTSHLCQF